MFYVHLVFVLCSDDSMWKEELGAAIIDTITSSENLKMNT